MITYVGEWIQHLVLLILIATFLDMLLPSNSMRRYVKMVVGLLMIMVILSPVLDLLQFDRERMLNSVDELFQNETTEQDDVQEEIEDQQIQVEEAQEEAILQEVENRWAQEMKHDIEATFPVYIEELAVQLEPSGERVEVKRVSVDLSREEERSTENDRTVEDRGPGSAEVNAEREAGPADSESTVAVRPVEPVQIEVNPGPGEPEESTTLEEKKLEDKVLTYLAEEWNISVDKISFSWTRR